MKNFNTPVLSAMFSLLWTLLLCSVLCIYSCWLLLFLAATFVMTSFKCQPTWNAKWNNFCRVAEAKEEGAAAGAGARCNNKLSYELAYDFHFENQHTHTHTHSPTNEHSHSNTATLAVGKAETDEMETLLPFARAGTKVKVGAERRSHIKCEPAAESISLSRIPLQPLPKPPIPSAPPFFVRKCLHFCTFLLSHYAKYICIVCPLFF